MPNKKKNAKEELAAQPMTELTDEEANGAAGGIFIFDSTASNSVRQSGGFLRGGVSANAADNLSETSSKDVNANTASGITNPDIKPSRTP